MCKRKKAPFAVIIIFIRNFSSAYSSFNFGAVMGGICCFLMPFAGSLTAMIIIWAANGFFQSMLWSPILRIYSEMINKKLKKRAILDISLSLPVGTVCAYLASTLIIKYFKSTSPISPLLKTPSLTIYAIVAA